MIYFREKRAFLKDVISQEIQKEDVQPGYPTWSEIHKSHLPKKPGVGKGTWCNRAAIRILERLGYNVDMVLDVNPYSGEPDLGYTSANGIVRNALKERKIWRVPESFAQWLANLGVGVLVGSLGIKGSGHVAVISPGKMNRDLGPYIGQAGGYNGFYYVRDSKAFGTPKVEDPYYFILRRENYGIIKKIIPLSSKACFA